MAEKIITEFWRKPGPTNKHDWLAFYDGDEPNDAGCMEHGEGATEAEAIRDLTENYPRDERGGLSAFGIRALGFDAPCRCGHEDGLHDPDGHCAVIGCPCTKFDAEETMTAQPDAKGAGLS